jgi:hypothetical protein
MTLVWVTAPAGTTRVALWDVDAAHPGGEAMVVMGQLTRVARTPAIEAALGAGLIVTVADPATTLAGYSYISDTP